MDHRAMQFRMRKSLLDSVLKGNAVDQNIKTLYNAIKTKEPKLKVVGDKGAVIVTTRKAKPMEAIKYIAKGYTGNSSNTTSSNTTSSNWVPVVLNDMPNVLKNKSIDQVTKFGNDYIFKSTATNLTYSVNGLPVVYNENSKNWQINVKE
jgi:hypothetical protein